MSAFTDEIFSPGEWGVHNTFSVIFEMITIAQDHYDKMLNLIRLLSSNISLLHPEATELHQVLQ